jgi:PIN domain nuclease of toxin-antitoxin system
MIVLDTHIWHWWVNQIPGKLSPEIIELIEETDEVVFSAYRELDGYLIGEK